MLLLAFRAVTSLFAIPCLLGAAVLAVLFLLSCPERGLALPWGSTCLDNCWVGAAARLISECLWRAAVVGGSQRGRCLAASACRLYIVVWPAAVALQGALQYESCHHGVVCVRSNNTSGLATCGCIGR